MFGFQLNTLAEKKGDFCTITVQALRLGKLCAIGIKHAIKGNGIQ